MPELHDYQVIRRPVIAEKSNVLTEANQYVFEVALNANKIQIKNAVETIFDIPGKVVKVRTMMMPAKRGRRGRKMFIRHSAWKKAIVTLEEGESLELFNV